ncbi:MAG: hypothetical protein VKP72_02170 [bacterium]|nr:hypothetical protein [bacterium]
MKPDPWKVVLWRRSSPVRGDRPLVTGRLARRLGPGRSWPVWAIAALVGTGGWQLVQGWPAAHERGDRLIPGLVMATPDPRQGDGLVWLNLASGIYHQEGCRYYETSGKGMLVSLEEARSHGRACQACLARSPENRRAPAPARTGRAVVLP